MVRWEAGARQRLQRAALALFAEHGYDGVTVAEIAAAAGLTERTFFRWFTDKREVLFTDQGEFEGSFLGPIEAGGAAPLDLVHAAIDSAAAAFPPERRASSRARQAVIDADPRLQERELLKLSLLAAAMTRALVAGGAGPVESALAAEHAVAVFRVAFAAWLVEPEARPLVEVQRETFARLRELVAAEPVGR